MDTEILSEFRIEVSEEAVNDLNRRLAHVRWPVEVSDASRADGVMLNVMRRLVDRWAGDFDWRSHEQELNRWQHWRTTIDGQAIHTVHLRSPRSDAVPLVLLHGWPSTFTEFSAVVDELHAPADELRPAFHLVVPSLPGFIFSGPLAASGWSAARMARAVGELMRRLGYDRYFVHGGDAGYIVGSALARVQADNVIGLHVNLGGVGLAQRHLTEEAQDDNERNSKEKYLAFARDKSGYALLNATRPQTLTYALTDSPVGQLAWIAEKFLDWKSPDYEISDDHILETASLYWFTGTAGSSARFYQAEYSGNRATPVPGRAFIEVPTAVSCFPDEIVPPVRRWAEDAYNIVRWTDMPSGGHFSALERPDLVIDALQRFSEQLLPHR